MRSIILFFVMLAVSIASSDDCKDTKCPAPPKHYEEFGCTPVKEAGKCCPSRWDKLELGLPCRWLDNKLLLFSLISVMIVLHWKIVTRTFVITTKKPSKLENNLIKKTSRHLALTDATVEHQVMTTLLRVLSVLTLTVLSSLDVPIIRQEKLASISMKRINVVSRKQFAVNHWDLIELFSQFTFLSPIRWRFE